MANISNALKTDLTEMLKFAREEYITFFRTKNPEMATYWGAVCLDLRARISKIDVNEYHQKSLKLLEGLR